MTEIIEAAIYEHSPELDQTACPTGYCTCNQKFATDDELATHQAAAVLAALTAAGTVEWGVLTALGMHVPYDTEYDARIIAAKNGSTPVSQLVLPWTEVQP